MLLYITESQLCHLTDLNIFYTVLSFYVNEYFSLNENWNKMPLFCFLGQFFAIAPALHELLFLKSPLL